MRDIRLLLLEDVETDADLIRFVLKRSGIAFQLHLAKNKREYVSALDDMNFDAIFADNSLPQFSAAEALEIYNAREMTIPFILVTGSISEEFAVQMMRDGACDYILKDRLQRLPAALRSALDKSRMEAERKKHLEEIIANEGLLREAAMLAHFGSWEVDVLNNSQRWSDEQFRIFGYEPGEVQPSVDTFYQCVHPEDKDNLKRMMDEAIRSRSRAKCNFRIVTPNSDIRHILMEMATTSGTSGQLLKINGFTMDVSEARASEIKEEKITAELLKRNKELEQFAYIISHNLRSPVANIVGLSDALIDDNFNDGEKADFMEALSVSIRKLDNVILDLNDILQVKNVLNESKQVVEFDKVVQEIMEDIGQSIKDNAVEIKFDFNEVNEMRTLKSYVHSIFYNLIANSIKFRQRGKVSEIEIKSRMLKDKIVLEFKDNGIGIDLAKKSNHVFGLYKRFHPEYAEGKGMGLFMVKTQAEALGGKINVESTVNEGTVFTLEFESDKFAG